MSLASNKECPGVGAGCYKAQRWIGSRGDTLSAGVKGHECVARTPRLSVPRQSLRIVLFLPGSQGSAPKR